MAHNLHFTHTHTHGHFLFPVLVSNPQLTHSFRKQTARHCILTLLLHTHQFLSVDVGSESVGVAVWSDPSEPRSIVAVHRLDGPASTYLVLCQVLGGPHLPIISPPCGI